MTKPESKRERIGWQVLNQFGVAVVSKLSALASIFIYSHFIGVADYGVLNISQSYFWIFLLFLSFNLHIAVGRYIYEPGADENTFLGGTIIVVGFVFLFSSGVLYFTASWLAPLLNLPASVILIILPIVLGMLSESLLTQLAIHDRRGGVLFITLATKALLSFFGSIILLQTLTKEKFLAVLFSESIASIGLCGFVIYFLRHRVTWRLRSSDVAYMVKYAVPLIPYMLSLTLMSQFDRVLVSKFYGNVVTGYYSLAFNVGALLTMAVSAVLNALTPSFFDALNKDDVSQLKRDTAAIFNCSVIAAAVIVLFGIDFANWILPTRYNEGFNLIPIVAVGGLCSVIFQSWIRVLAFKHRTMLIAGLGMLGCALSMGLNLWLLPITSYKIAAYTNMATYLFISILCVVIVNKVSSFSISLKRELKWIGLMGMLLPLSLVKQTPQLLLLKAIILVCCVWSLRQSIQLLISRKRR